MWPHGSASRLARAGGRAPPSRDTPPPAAGSRSPGAARAPPAPRPRCARAPPTSDRRAAPGHAPPAGPGRAASPPCSRSSPRSSRSPAAHSEACSPRCSTTIRTARARTSGEYLVRLLIAPSSQAVEPPANPARFTSSQEPTLGNALESGFFFERHARAAVSPDRESAFPEGGLAPPGQNCGHAHTRVITSGLIQGRSTELDALSRRASQLRFFSAIAGSDGAGSTHSSFQVTSCGMINAPRPSPGAGRLSTVNGASPVIPWYLPVPPMK